MAGKGTIKLVSNSGDGARQKELEEVSNEDLLKFFLTIFQTDVRFRIVATLSSREGAGLREIARHVGISHKNLAKYLQDLEEKGVLETYPIGVRNRVYRLAPKYGFVKRSLNHFQ